MRIGAHSMTSGGAKVGKDIPPYAIAQGYPARLRGINHVGLRRRGYTPETIKLLRQAYRRIFFDTETLFDELLERVRADFADCPEVSLFVDFLCEAKSSDRGFLRPLRAEQEGESKEKAKA